MRTLITGGFARVPGNQVGACLAVGTELKLVPEPENPYDSAAIKVLASPEAIPAEAHQELSDRLEGTGWTLDEVLQLDSIHIGYVAATDGKPLARAGLTIGNREFLANQPAPSGGPWYGQLCFAASGEPMVEISASLAAAEPSK